MMDDAERALETALLLRVQAGEAAAFPELVRRFDSPLRYFVRRIVGDVAAADDLVQDVWISALRQLNDLRSGAALRVWLFRVARNRSISHLRREAIRVADDIDVAEIADDAEPDELRAEDAARIHEGLATLSIEHREAITLRFLEDMSYDEIAAVVGCSVGTVRSRLHYAKKHLTEAIRDTAGSLSSERTR
jgi:RNA polymerase sigma-70 factor, ECF subfamily